MELVFRIIDQAGHRHELRRLGGPILRIGRAFDNDLVLTDPTVSPCHAVIEETPDGRVVMRDLDSLNGVYLGGRRRQRVTGETELVSGGVYQLGKSRVVVYSTDHPVPETVRIGGTDNAIELLDNPLILAGAVLLAAFIYGAEQWLNMFSGFEWRAVANVLLVVLGSSLAVAIFWAVVGRVLRHESHFKKQFTVILFFLGAQFFLTGLYDILLFNTLDVFLSTAVLVVFQAALLGGLLWLNLYLATNQTPAQRARSAAIIAVLLVVLSLYSEVIFRPEFSETPDYVRVLEPPFLHFSGSVPEEVFLADAAMVFERLEDGGSEE